MAKGHFTSYKSYRCGVCQKFFSHTGGTYLYWGCTIKCPHCNAELTEEPVPMTGVPCSGVMGSWIHVVSTGIPSGLPFFPMGVSGI